MNRTTIDKNAADLAPHYHGPEVEDPVYRATIARMFRSDFLEFFSKVHPAVPAVLFAPVVVFATYGALRGLSVPLTLVGMAAGFFFWTFAEYVLHRYVFHIPLMGPLSKFLYFQSHGIHHQYPDDFYRLLMVPPVSVPLAAAFWGLFALVIPAPWAMAVFAGFTLGYLAYDYTHFAVHHLKPPRAAWLAPVATWFKAARKRHMVHHFDTHDKGYGVSTGFWDHVFGTVADR
jgi:sterol desaturase/sphingolipid hydroxylase (fatty acid hydroxylase superfamily)